LDAPAPATGMRAAQQHASASVVIADDQSYPARRPQTGDPGSADRTPLRRYAPLDLTTRRPQTGDPGSADRTPLRRYAPLDLTTRRLAGNVLRVAPDGPETVRRCVSEV